MGCAWMRTPAFDAYAIWVFISTCLAGHPDKIVPSLRDFPLAENHVTYSQPMSQPWARGACTLRYRVPDIFINLLHTQTSRMM